MERESAYSSSPCLRWVLTPSSIKGLGGIRQQHPIPFHRSGGDERDPMKKKILIGSIAFGLLGALLIGRALLHTNSRNYSNYISEGCPRIADTQYSKYQKPLTIADRTAFIRVCETMLLKAVTPCIKEYDFGTDSGVQCFSRYAGPVYDVLGEMIVELTLSPTRPNFPPTQLP